MFLQSALLENRVDVVSRDECDVDHPAEQSQDVGQQWRRLPHHIAECTWKVMMVQWQVEFVYVFNHVYVFMKGYEMTIMPICKGKVFGDKYLLLYKYIKMGTKETLLQLVKLEPKILGDKYLVPLQGYLSTGAQ